MVQIRVWEESTADPTPYLQYLMDSATIGGIVALVQLLLEAGADINEGLRPDNRPLSNACKQGNVEMVQFLLSEGADPRADESWALRTACMCERFDVALLLLNAGADPRTSKYALHWARSIGWNPDDQSSGTPRGGS